MEQLFSDSRIYSKLDMEQSTCTLQKSCKNRAFLAVLVLWMEQKFLLVKSPPKMAITTMIARRGQVSLILPYSVSLTLVCDFNQKFTFYLTSYPGSCHDSYVFSNMQIAQISLYK
ncbi:uncharacterized protein VP01_2271g3 [Puccinia sorghi]|uniref:DDE Tnp4 domain-containing protein n=1 Tax=Puccinia sorghi TaxID=27349 RepID=A0A0L6V897_9BASI|nr:uncharacterized protein VP01_2271g3 [Puccinia sorghi]